MFNDILNPTQRELVEKTVVNIKSGDLSLLEFVENSRIALTARNADERNGAVNELCAVILALGEADNSKELEQDSPILLDYLLSKVEDSGHISDLLIPAIHHLIVNRSEAVSFQHVQLNNILASLFTNNGVQNYGKKDRLLLFAMFDRLLDTHFDALLSLDLYKTTLTAFLAAAQGERDPRVLLSIFKIHQRMASQMKTDLFVEDMFELVECYFPIDYEPNEKDKSSSMVTPWMVQSGLQACLLANNAFAPFCLQLVAEKLVDTSEDLLSDSPTMMGKAGEAGLIGRQLDICRLFIAACNHFTNISGPLLHNLDDILTGFRLIFINPAQNRQLLEDSTRVVGEAMQALVRALRRGSQVEAGNEDQMERVHAKMVDSMIENVEPFVLQAEMGTMSKACRLLQCLSESGIASGTQRKVAQRVLYWLDLLVVGQTLRSQSNHEEIAMEAIEEVPFWLKLLGRIGQDEAGDEVESAILVEKTVEPLLEGIFALESANEGEKLAILRCQVLSSLLVPFSTPNATSNSYSNTLKKSAKFVEICTQHFQAVHAMDLATKNDPNVTQFLALLASSGIPHKNLDVELLELTVLNGPSTSANPDVEKTTNFRQDLLKIHSLFKEVHAEQAQPLRSLLDTYSQQNDGMDQHQQEKQSAEHSGDDPSPLWRQRFISQFVPVYIDAMQRIEEPGGPNRCALLAMVGPLMNMIGQFPRESMLTELATLGPVVVQALPLAFAEEEKPLEAQEDSSSLCTCLLEGIRLLLASMDGEKLDESSGQMLNSVTLCMARALISGVQPLRVQVAALDCLQLIAHRFESQKLVLAPLYTPVVRALAGMTSSRKRGIRRRVAETRNAWELLFA